MAETESLHRRSGYCSHTGIYRSIRPDAPLPPPSASLSISSYALSLLRTTTSSTALSTTAFLIDADTGHRLTYSTFLQQVSSLSSSLKSLHPSISKNDVGFVLSPPSLHIPVLYFSLLSLGIAVSPSNPLSSASELAHQIQLSKPSIAFSTSALARKLPPNLRVILLDSDEFLSMLESRDPIGSVAANQSDTAAVLYSSGTTGKVKGVVLTHRNLIAAIARFYHSRICNGGFYRVSLVTVPLFHVFGLVMMVRAASVGESVVVMGRFDFVKMVEAVERYGVTYMATAPPVVVAMVKSDLVELRSLQVVRSGGAPLGEEVAKRFRIKFPRVGIVQGYGLTETTGGITRTSEGEEMEKYGSVGRLADYMEAKIVDPCNGLCLPPERRGELWLRGPAIMKGYAGDDTATIAVLNSEGWLKTGDLCYFDREGFLFIVDRLKELIKYKGYQVPPAELEHILQTMPEIADAAVIPYPDEETGQVPMAYVVRKPGTTISATHIMDFIASQVTPYKKIRRVAFVNSIPKSPAGKILRRHLLHHALSKL